MPREESRAEIARSMFLAFAAGDRERIEELLAPEFVFFSPPDPGLDRTGYFERCWPHSGTGTRFDFVRTIEAGDEVIVTYEGTRTAGSRFRNTEVLSFDGARIVKAEVYFGWDLD
ncbi:MAG TPA: nuclear transport factor 2 family protein [Solirubrobacterales bacterium]|nr:nuclear transport factor 2 family protein [Solirubrobacterales bacterium]